MKASITIYKGNVYVNGEKTTNPELIGLTILDIAEKPNETRYEISKNN